MDIARVETVTPIRDRIEPDIPPVIGEPTLPDVVHRHVKAEANPTPGTALTSSEMIVPFPLVPERSPMSPSLGVATGISWSPTTGFTGASESQRMLLEQDDGSAESPTPEPLLRYLPVPGPRRESPPRDLVDLVQRVTGVGVGDAVIDRSPEVSDRAAAMGAIAFTDRATVHLPAELGDLDSVGTRAVVAHELTHVAQQRVLGSSPPNEDSPEGRELEAQARAVQDYVGRGVRPTFIRTNATTPEIIAGIQRLANDDDQFAWQHRNPPEREARFDGTLGSIFGAPDDADQRRGHADERTAQDLEWARNFEREQAHDLQQLRDRRYEELLDEARRESRIEALRTGEAEAELTRADLIHLRTALDEEMPYEFGPPDGVVAYPGQLPPETDVTTPQAVVGGHSDSSTTHAALAVSSASTHPRPSGSSRPSASTRRVGSHGAAHGAGRTGGGGHHPGGAGPGSGVEDSQFDWQHRQATDRETVSQLFGESLFGDLFGGSIEGDEPNARRRVEAERLPELTTQRHEYERDLRHANLRAKRLEATREEQTPAPIALTHDEIVELRVQVDQDRPLEFEMPDYLAVDRDVSINTDGSFGGPLPTASPTETTPAGSESSSLSTTTPRILSSSLSTTTPTTTPTIVSTTTPTGDAGHAPVAESAQHHEAAIGTLIGMTGSVATDPMAHHDAHDVTPPDVDELDAGRIFSAASDLDLEVLSRRLWGRIRREIRNELLIDRERAGVLADVR